MKLLITTLTMIFISFGASAFTVESLYKKCKSYQNNGFDLQNLSQMKKTEAFMCMSYLAGIRDIGRHNCRFINEYKIKNSLDIDKLNSFAIFTANADVAVNQVITSFINYAENNPDKWKYSSASYSKRFINDKFPCKLDK